jgi:D-arabinose 1-dehydrogenase-like Zn-dependent alcohol dehydrogenase
MNAAWYEKQGLAPDVLVIGTMPDPEPGPGEVRIRVAASGINPGDIKKRQDAFGYGMPYPRVIPHSDGAGTIDRVGEGVPASRVGERVWCYGAQSYRPFGTAAEYVAISSGQAVPLPDAVSFEQGACLGIPGITAHRGVHVAGSVAGRVVLVQGYGDRRSASVSRSGERNTTGTAKLFQSLYHFGIIQAERGDRPCGISSLRRRVCHCVFPTEARRRERGRRNFAA